MCVCGVFGVCRRSAIRLPALPPNNLQSVGFPVTLCSCMLSVGHSRDSPECSVVVPRVASRKMKSAFPGYTTQSNQLRFVVQPCLFHAELV